MNKYPFFFHNTSVYNTCFLFNLRHMHLIITVAELHKIELSLFHPFASFYCMPLFLSKRSPRLLRYCRPSTFLPTEFINCNITEILWHSIIVRTKRPSDNERGELLLGPLSLDICRLCTTWFVISVIIFSMSRTLPSKKALKQALIASKGFLAGKFFVSVVKGLLPINSPLLRFTDDITPLMLAMRRRKPPQLGNNVASSNMNWKYPSMAGIMSPPTITPQSGYRTAMRSRAAASDMALLIIV